jgi:hypothetical protein
MKTENSFVPIVLLSAALATGGLIANWIGLGRAMSRLSVSAYVEFHQHTNLTFDPYVSLVVIGALAGGAALAVKYLGQFSRVRKPGLKTSRCDASKQR